MELIDIIYASAPTDEVIIPTLEIQVPGKEPLRICSGYEDHYLGVDDQMKLFLASAMSVSLPAKNTSGQQNLSFGVPDVEGIASKYVDAALEANVPSTMIYREYLMSDKSAPAKKPVKMTIAGGSFDEENGDAAFEGSYYDLLNYAWPRETYNSENALGLKYL